MYFLIGIVIFIILIIIGAIIIYNSLISLKRRVENAWSQIDVQLRRRHDLIPNLVNAVKGYMKFEKETLTKVIEARAKAINSSSIQEKAAAEGELSNFLGRLMAIVESYPELKASESVAELMEELKNTENRISFARQLYNDLVTRFNTKISIFPHNIIAGIFQFKPFELFKIENEEVKEVPKVEL